MSILFPKPVLDTSAFNLNHQSICAFGVAIYIVSYMLTNTHACTHAHAHTHTVVWKLFDKNISMIINFKVKYFYGCITFLVYFGRF